MQDVKQKLRNDFWSAYLAELAFWPAFQAVNFWKVPVRHQLLAVNLACLVDATFLCWCAPAASNVLKQIVWACARMCEAGHAFLAMEFTLRSPNSAAVACTSIRDISSRARAVRSGYVHMRGAGFRIRRKTGRGTCGGTGRRLLQRRRQMQRLRRSIPWSSTQHCPRIPSIIQ